MGTLVRSPKGIQYEVGKLLGENEQYRLYATALFDGRAAILKIVLAPEQNGSLDREAYILQTLREEATATEVEYAKTKTGDTFLNYQLCFPDLIESFISEEQQKRRINILCMSETSKKLGDLVPLAHLVSKEQVRIDPKTSAWILGKLLKLLVFAHSQDISVGLLTGDNILIHRENHYVTVFDWSQANLIGGGVPENTAAEEIAAVTRAVVIALGGYPETGMLLPDEQLEDGRYEDLLKQLLSREFAAAVDAHKHFYEVIRALWPRVYYPFTTYKI